MQARGNGRCRFGEFEFDSESRALFRNGWPVKIQPQPLRVLAVLLDRPGEIVSREELRRQVWGESTFVEFDEGLNYSVRQIRLALHDKAANPTYVETLPKQGYRFIADIERREGLSHDGVSADGSAMPNAPATEEAPR